MKVNGYYVRWEYRQELLEFKDTLENRFITVCVIKDADKEEISSGETILNPTDRYNKEKAKKRSLERALLYFPKEERMDFWETYRTMTKIPKW